MINVSTGRVSGGSRFNRIKEVLYRLVEDSSLLLPHLRIGFQGSSTFRMIIYRVFDVKSSIFQPKRHAASPRKQINGNWFPRRLPIARLTSLSTKMAIEDVEAVSLSNFGVHDLWPRKRINTCPEKSQRKSLLLTGNMKTAVRFMPCWPRLVVVLVLAFAGFHELEKLITDERLIRVQHLIDNSIGLTLLQESVNSKYATVAVAVLLEVLLRDGEAALIAFSDLVFALEKGKAARLKRHLPRRFNDFLFDQLINVLR
jgi:hypothetical protein